MPIAGNDAITPIPHRPRDHAQCGHTTPRATELADNGERRIAAHPDAIPADQHDAVELLRVQAVLPAELAAGFRLKGRVAKRPARVVPEDELDRRGAEPAVAIE